MTYKFILALDPSGNFNEGKGTTGWSVYNALDNRISNAGSITAKGYKTMEAYWHAHILLIQKYCKRYGEDLCLVIEDYFLYSNRIKEQINSKLETPKLIGVLQYICFLNGIPYILQPASEVKTRWTNVILIYKELISYAGKHYHIPRSKSNLDRHSLDSIRHAVHFATFKNGKETVDVI